MREIAFNLLYVSAVLMIGVLGMALYSVEYSRNTSAAGPEAVMHTPFNPVGSQATPSQ